MALAPTIQFCMQHWNACLALSNQNGNGRGWRMTGWAADEPVKRNTRINVGFEAGQVSGLIACNHYRASVNSASSQVILSLSPEQS